MEKPNDDIKVLFCSIDCMVNPAKIVEYTISEISESGEKETFCAREYYSKDSNDLAILMEFLERMGPKMKVDLNLSMGDIRGLMENMGGYLYVRKFPIGNLVIKHKVYLHAVELKKV